MIRRVFQQTGFLRIRELSNKEFTFDGCTTDFDDVYVYENLVLCLEYTTAAAKNVGDHLKSKKIAYDKIGLDTIKFFRYLCSISEELKNKITRSYEASEIVMRVLYCSLNDFDDKYKNLIKDPIYLDYAALRYFKNLTDCVKKSSQYELFAFLKISPNLIGDRGKIGIAISAEHYSGTLLPETNSNFDAGYKVVSFYLDPEALIKRAYVLRKDGWRDSVGLYQRMISRPKIEAIRKYLKSNKRVFVNNIIVTLADDTKIIDDQGNTIDPTKINKTSPVKIQIPSRINTIGMIDGQHRTFSYYEAVNDDVEIAKLRRKQNLLVTGIIYPAEISALEKEKFEARLFLEINSTQTNAKSDLKQAIGLVLDPFSPESIATQVLITLNRNTGPLNGQIERHWFDKNKLKPTSIVSYAIKPLVKTSGSDSIFHLWDSANKEKMVQKHDAHLLSDYVNYCVSEINKFLSAAKINLPKELWVTDKSVAGRMLTTTNINSLLICLRIIIENNKAKGFAYYKANLKDLRKFNFKRYHSSQYTRMATAIYEKFFT